jgi:hypothetical protein
METRVEVASVAARRQVSDPARASRAHSLPILFPDVVAIAPQWRTTTDPRSKEQTPMAMKKKTRKKARRKKAGRKGARKGARKKGRRKGRRKAAK